MPDHHHERDEIIPTDELEQGNKLVDMWLDAIRSKCARCGDALDVEAITLMLLPNIPDVKAWHACGGKSCNMDEPGVEVCGCELLYTQSMALMLAVALRRLAVVA